MNKIENRINAFKWWRELKLYTKKSLISKYYYKSDFFVIDSSIDKIEEMYLKERERENGTENK